MVAKVRVNMASMARAKAMEKVNGINDITSNTDIQEKAWKRIK